MKARRSAALALLAMFAFPSRALAHNCSGLSDCYGTILAAVLALLGLLLLLTAPYLVAGLVARFALTSALRSLAGAAIRSTLSRASARVAAQIFSRSWHRATFPNPLKSLLYHHGKHGAGRSIGRYTRDAARFFRQNRNLGKNVTLKDGTPGIRIKLGKGQPGGYFTPKGKVVTFWYK